MGHIVFKTISQNKNPESLSGLLEITHLRSGDLHIADPVGFPPGQVTYLETHCVGHISYFDNGLQI